MLEMIGDTTTRLLGGAVMHVAVYYWYITLALLSVSYAIYKWKSK